MSEEDNKWRFKTNDEKAGEIIEAAIEKVEAEFEVRRKEKEAAFRKGFEIARLENTIEYLVATPFDGGCFDFFAKYPTVESALSAVKEGKE